MRADVPALPQPHRRRRARDIRPDRARRSRSANRGPERRPGCSTGSFPTSGTSATPTSRPRTATRVVDFARLDPARRLLQRAGARHAVAGALRERLHTLPEQPDLIPYRTSYYERTWGFCLSHSQLLELAPGDYEVVIDSTLEPGHLTYAELADRGRAGRARSWSPPTSATRRSPTTTSPGSPSRRCSPSGSSGDDSRHTYRFLFAPGTIGPLAWLHREPRPARPHRARARALLHRRRR